MMELQLLDVAELCTAEQALARVAVEVRVQVPTQVAFVLVHRVAQLAPPRIERGLLGTVEVLQTSQQICKIKGNVWIWCLQQTWQLS